MSRFLWFTVYIILYRV